MTHDQEHGLVADMEDVLQEDVDPMRLTPIPVVVQGPVRTQEMPGVRTVVYQVWADSAGGIVTPHRILGDDPRRQHAHLVAQDQAMRIGTSQKQVFSPDACAIWPAGIPVTVHGTSELWVAADTGATRISAVISQWAH